MVNRFLCFSSLLLLLLLPASRLFPTKATPGPNPDHIIQIIPPPAKQTTQKAKAFPGPGPPPEAHIIENCTVTWYTADTCGKPPDHPAYGITASGLPVEAGVTCAVDPNVIPLFSAVCVEYADGNTERLQATDTGVTGNWIDIYTADYDCAVRHGLQKLTVYWTAPGE